MTATLQPLTGPFRAPPAEPHDLVFRLTVAEYHEMRDKDILNEEHAVELLEGWLIPKMTKKPLHTVATNLTTAALHSLIPSGWFVNVQEPITTIDSEPEPDVSLIRGKPRDYKNSHPTTDNVGLIVEIADTSLDRDRGIKKRLYARATISCYWIINLIDRQVEVYTDSSGPGDEPDYGKCDVISENEQVPVVLDGKKVGGVPVRDLLP